MVRKLLCYFFIFTTGLAFAQEEKDKIFFSEALSLHLPKYEKKAKEAYRFRQFEEAQRLFDSLVDHCLKGSYMNNFKFKNLKGKAIAFNDFKKPVYFTTYASWCVASKGEIPALNKLAEEYGDQIDFVVLFWDSKKATKQAAKKFNKQITVLYVNELDNRDAYVIRHLKHSLGLPTTFLLDESNKILDIRRGVTHPPEKSMDVSFDLNYNKMFDGIANHLLGGKILQVPGGPVASN